jgi:phasin
MATKPPGSFEVPPEMRTFAEKSFNEARQAFDNYLAAAHRTIAVMEGQAESARQGAKTIGTRAMDYAERNVASSFDFAQKLVRAKDLKEIIELQSDFLRAQMQALTEQAKDLSDSTADLTADQMRRPPRY